jgi:hypothetical protein
MTIPDDSLSRDPVEVGDVLGLCNDLLLIIMGAFLKAISMS